MPLEFTLRNPQELVVLIVAIGGLIPVVAYYRKLTRWFLLPYGFLVIGALATNIENVRWYGPFNAVEHGIGNLGVGLSFAALAYVHRRRIRSAAAKRTSEDS